LIHVHAVVATVRVGMMRGTGSRHDKNLEGVHASLEGLVFFLEVFGALL
jgi:hypothetical protein